LEDAVEGVFFLEEGGEVGAELRGKGGGERGGDLEARWGGGRGVVCYHFGGGSWEVGACGRLSWEEGLERRCVGFTEVIVSEGLREGIFDMAAFGGISWRASFRVACLAGVWRCIISEPSTDHVEI